MKPDFLYIGAPRAGSTWLQHNLDKHPQIWLPPSKNILYFHPRFQRYRLKFVKYFGKGLFSENPETRAWLRKFFFTPIVTDKWYSSLFPDTPQIKGEIAEAYCSLKEEDIKRIHTMNPDVKIIFTMRNPFERALSHAKLGVLKRKKRTIHDITEEQFLAHINHPSSEARSRYSHAFNLWEKYFPKEQFLIQFYEDLQNEPQTYLQNICTFLNIEYNDDIFAETIEQRINPSNHDEIPDSIIRHTAQKYEQEINILADRFDSHALKWKKELNEILK